MAHAKILEIELESDEVVPGGEVNVRITLRPRRDLHVQAGSVALSCYGNFPGPPTNGVVGSPILGTLFAQIKSQFLGMTTLPPGTEPVFDVSILVPKGAPPTYVGTYVGVWWFVEAKVALKLARDLKAKAPIFILAPPPVDAESISGSFPRQRKADCTIQFILPSPAVKQGDSLEGRLVIQPTRDIQAREVRAQLRRVESVFKGPATFSDVIPESNLVLARDIKFPGTLTHTFDFRFDIPSDHYQPTIRTEAGMAYWELAALVDHGRKCFASQPLIVYNAEAPP